MPENSLPEEMLIITPSSSPDISGREQRRGSIVPRILNTESVNIINLRDQINVFVKQISVIMSDTPEKTGEFHLSEFEVSAGITIQGKGEIKIALLGSGEITGGINATLKFVFKRS